MLRRTAFKRKRPEGPTAPAEPHPKALQPAVRRGTYAGTTTASPKTRALRNPRLLALAKGSPCLLMVPGCCNHRVDTTVACHSNLSIHGKAGARKADDCWSCWGCAACHAWLDQGPADADLKKAVFMAAHARQIAFWRDIAYDASRPEADRRAAQWALEQLENNN